MLTSSTCRVPALTLTPALAPAQALALTPALTLTPALALAQPSPNPNPNPSQVGVRVGPVGGDGGGGGDGGAPPAISVWHAKVWPYDYTYYGYTRVLWLYYCCYTHYDCGTPRWRAAPRTCAPVQP